MQNAYKRAPHLIGACTTTLIRACIPCSSYSNSPVCYIFLSFSKFETRQEKMELKNITEKIVEEAFAKKFAVLDEIKNNTYTKW